MRPFYSESEMFLMLQEAKRLGMRFPKGSESLPISVWCDVANGIGPGAWSRMARKISTTLQPFAVIAAILHDMAYCCPIKDRAHFNRANDDFYHNIQVYIRAHTWRISLIRFLAMREAWVEYQAVHLGGWDAFVTGRTIPELDDEAEEGQEIELRSSSRESTFGGETENSA